MNEQEIRAEYSRLYAGADKAERVRLMQVLRSRAEQSGLRDWVTLLDARLAVLQDQHDTAVALSTALVEQPALSADVRSWALLIRGVAHWRKGEPDKAIAEYNAVIDDPTSPPEPKAWARYNRGVAYGAMGEPHKEMADYTAVIDDPTSPPEQKAWARYNRGVEYHKMRRWDKAIADFTAVIDDPNAPADLTAFARRMMSVAGLRPQKAAQAAVDLPVEIDPQTRENFKRELAEGRKRKREFFGESRFDARASFLLVAREWNSYTPAVPDEGEPSRGGGYFIKHLGTGIVIDPGYDFLEIFAEAGGRLCDVDHIVVTHAHNDHTAELEAILTLLFEFNEGLKDSPQRQKKVNLYLSQGAARKFAGLLPLKDCGYLGEVLTLNRGSKENPQKVRLSKQVALTVLPAHHDDVVTRDYAVGLGFEFSFEKDPPRRLLFTGDTALLSAEVSQPGKAAPHIYQAYPPPFCDPGADLVVAHIGSIEESELEGPLGRLAGEGGSFAPAPTYEKHLGLIGTFVVLYGLRPKAAVVSEFGEEMKSIWIKAVRLIGRKLNEVLAGETPPGFPVFAGDPVMLYDIRNGQFLCHEDLEFHDGAELTMLGVHEVVRGGIQGPVRPYLFLAGKTSRMEDESDREDRVRAFHEALRSRTLPHFVEAAK